MLTLGLDTLGGQCAVALWRGRGVDDGRGGGLIAKIVEPMQRGHAEALLPMVRAVMDQAGEDLSTVDKLAAARGPGSFTGLRIGLAAARGLALALGRPAVGVSRLEAMAAGYFAQPARPGTPLAVAIDAARGQIYLQLFANKTDKLSQAMAVDIEAIATVLPRQGVVVVGSGADLLQQAAGDAGIGAQINRETGDLVDQIVALGAARDPAGDPAAPLYLRAPDAKLPGGVGLRLDG